MNQTITDILERCSVRQYTAKQITDEELDLVLKAGLYAANGMNRQSSKIIALQNKEDIAVLSKMNANLFNYTKDPFYGAPTVLIVLSEKDCPTGVEDGSLIIGNMLIAARSLGLGSCWIHRAREEFASETGKSLLKKWGITGEYIAIGHCLLGYPAQSCKQNNPRKSNRIIKIR